ncbi:MAG: alpha/beta fold hydrolase [Actinomycetes bacterium]
MRLGADPDQLDRLARSFARAAARVRESARRVAVAQDRAVGPGAAPRAVRRLLGETLAPLHRLADLLGERAADLRRRARFQRVASVPFPGVTTVHESRAGDGRWLGRVGPPDAPTVVVLVPGVGTHLGHRRRLGREAVRLSEHLTAQHPDHPVTVYAWLGYDTPDTLLAGVDPRPAGDGARTLATDLAHLRSQGAERVVLVGHSYGALVATRAVASGREVDELVLLGAPGLGVADPGTLRLRPGGTVWSALEGDDPVAWVARTGVLHGPDPASVARPLPTGDLGHSRYLSDQVLLDALGEVVVGRRA